MAYDCGSSSVPTTPDTNTRKHSRAILAADSRVAEVTDVGVGSDEDTAYVSH